MKSLHKLAHGLFIAAFLYAPTVFADTASRNNVNLTGVSFTNNNSARVRCSVQLNGSNLISRIVQNQRSVSGHFAAPNSDVTLKCKTEPTSGASKTWSRVISKSNLGTSKIVVICLNLPQFKCLFQKKRDVQSTMTGKPNLKQKVTRQNSTNNASAHRGNSGIRGGATAFKTFRFRVKNAGLSDNGGLKLTCLVKSGSKVLKSVTRRKNQSKKYSVKIVPANYNAKVICSWNNYHSEAPLILSTYNNKYMNINCQWNSRFVCSFSPRSINNF